MRFIAMLVLAATASACTSREAPSPGRSDGDASAAIQAVSLPDLSRASESARRQLNDRYAVLSGKIGNPATPPAERATEYGEMGKLLMAAELYDAAEACFLNAEALAPDQMRWPYYLGHVYKLTGESTKAAAAFERALRVRPDDVATLVWLGEAYLDQARPEEAETLFAKAQALQPTAVAARVGRGRAALATEDYAGAIEHLEAALTMDPRASIVHYPLAMAYRARGEREKADLHLRQRGNVDVVPPDPLMQELGGLLESAVAYEHRGLGALNKGEFAAAAAYFRKGVELAPDDASLRHELGTALSLEGDTAGAVSQFEEAVRLSPRLAKSHFSLGVLMASSGRLPQAIERFSNAVKYEPNYVEARLQLANALAQNRRTADSLQHYEQVIRINPRLADARLAFAMALVRLNRYADAREQLAEGAKHNPEDARIAQALARMSSALDQPGR